MSEITEKLLEIRNKTLAANKVEPEAQAVPEPDNGEPQAQTEASTEQNETKVEPEAETRVEASWDDTPETKEPTAEIKLDWVSDLGLGEIKSADEVKTKVSELKAKLKEFEEKPLSGVPDDFKEMIEVAKTGDWKDYLASQLIDYSKLNPIEEFERDFFKRAEQNQKYYTDGKFDEQKVYAEIDTMPEAVRELYGSQLIQAEAQIAERQRAAIKAKAEAKRTEAEKSLAQSTKSLSEILPLDTYGIKFEQKHSSAIYDGVTSSKLTKKHLGGTFEDVVRAGFDMKTLTRTIALAEYGEKMISYKAKNSEVKAKKDILTQTQNIQLNPTTTSPNPEDPGQKVQTPKEKLEKYYSSIRRGL